MHRDLPLGPLEASLICLSDLHPKSNAVSSSLGIVRALPPVATRDFPETNWTYLVPLGYTVTAYVTHPKASWVASVKQMKFHLIESSSGQSSWDLRLTNIAQRGRPLSPFLLYRFR